MKNDGVSLMIGSVLIAAVCIVAFFYPHPVKERPVVVKKEFNTTSAGEKVGKNVGRWSHGFFRGLWRSNDNK